MHTPDKPHFVQQEEQFTDPLEQLMNSLHRQNIPDELRDEWEEYLDDAEDDDDLHKRIDYIKEKIAKRIKNAEIKFTKPRPSEAVLFDPEIQKDTIAAIARVVEETKSGALTEIGYGNTARVYMSNKHQNLCYKIITNTVDYRLSANVEGEMRIQNSVSQLNVNGVRAPKPYYYHMDERNHLCIMEAMPAATLEEIRLGQKKLPDDFDIEKRFNDLREFITQMHQKLGIYHRDLHDRNIMFDLADGTIYVIDFGRAVRDFGESRDIYKLADGSVIQLTDEQNVERHYQTLKKLLSTRSKLSS